jgi:DNA invertase Pin-like site-specific DNA recombinase
MERNLTSERTTAALAHKKSTGRAYTRITPFGFDRVGDMLKENEGEMEVVRHMQHLKAQGVSLRRIAAMLNQTQTPTKLGGTWHLATVQSVLRVHRSC